jgi:hypothetical protein
MNDEPTSKKDSRSLDARFASRPHVYARLQSIVDGMDKAIAEGHTADEAEAMAIEQIQRLGQELLTDWAEEKQKQSVEQAKARHPQASQHIKKK